jgi:hypothetical protein
MINDILTTQDSRQKNNNLEVKMNSGAPILFVTNRIGFGSSSLKVSPKIVIKKDEAVKSDKSNQPIIETSPFNPLSTQAPVKSKKDEPDVDPLARRLVNDTFNLNGPNYLHKQNSLPATLADLNSSLLDASRIDNNPLNSTTVIQDSIEKSLADPNSKPSFKLTENIVFKNNEKKKDITINPVDDSEKKVNKFSYTKSYVKEESILTSPSTSTSSNPTPSKKDTFTTPIKLDSVVTPVKMAGNISYEQTVVGRINFIK